MMRDWAELMAAYHEQVKKIVEIVMVSSAPHAVVDGRVAQSIYPADFLTRTRGLRARQQAVVTELKRRGLTPGEIWVTGSADPEAEKLLLDLGWRRIESSVEDKLYGKQ